MFKCFFILNASIDWTAVSSIATIAAFIVAAIYTFVTYKIFKETANAAKSSAVSALSTANAAKQNSIANELSAYLELRKDLLTEVFVTVVKYSRNSNLVINNNAKGPKNEEWVIDNTNKLNITESCLIKDVFNNIEDLALFYCKDILTIETIDSGFGYSILYLGKNEVIRALIRKDRENGLKVYEGFELLYAAIYKRLTAPENSKFKPTLLEN